MLAQVFLGSAEQLPTRDLAFSQKGGDLGVIVLEDLAEQEDGSFGWVQLFEPKPVKCSSHQHLAAN